jgi:hypothetical protein
VVTAAWEPWGARHERRGPETARWGAPADAQRRSERLASRQRRGPGARDARGDNRPSHLSGAASRPHAVVTARPEPQGRRGDVRRRHRERHGRCTQPMAPTPGSVVRRGCQCSVETTCRTLMLRPTRSQLLSRIGLCSLTPCDSSFFGLFLPSQHDPQTTIFGHLFKVPTI